MSRNRWPGKFFSFYNRRWLFLLSIAALFLFQFPIQAQEQKKTRADSLKSNKLDTTLLKSTTNPKINIDSTRIKSREVSPQLDESYIDSVDELFDNEDITIPTPLDTTNKIRLPVNLKKTKFAYFDASQSIGRIIPNNAFDVGEELTFAIRYGPVVAGYSTMSIPKIAKINGYESYQIVTKARTSGFFSAFFKVRDQVESYIDRDGLFSWRFEKHLREGKYRDDQYVIYDQVNGWAVSNKGDSMRIPPCIHDILSSFYYVRTQQLEVGKSLYIDNHANNKLYPLEVKVHKKERVKVDAGEFDCVVVEPILRVAGLFKSKGRLLIWLTDDERKIPVQMKSKIFIGYITVELKAMEGVKKATNVGI